MERIDAPFVLDAILLLVLLLGSIGGLWRGVRREIYVSLGLLLGYALSVSWVNSMTRDLRDVWSISADRAHFLVSAAFIVVPMLVVGVLGPRAAEHRPPEFAGRVGGALLAIVNLLTAATLIGRWARQDLLGTDEEQDLRATRILDRITDEPGLLMLGAAASGLALLLAALWVKGRRRSQFRQATPIRAADARVHRREQPALAPEAEKVEPRTTGLGGWASRASTRPSDAAATVAIPVVNDMSRANGGRAGNGAGQQSTSEWLTVTRPEPRGKSDARCLTCGEGLTDSDRFCPRCGRSLE